MVIVDLPGGASALALKAFHRSHFVLIPAQPSMPDVKAAMKTVAQIDDAQELARAPIARAMVWTRIMPGFESVPVRQVRAAVEESADTHKGAPAGTCRCPWPRRIICDTD